MHMLNSHHATVRPGDDVAPGTSRADTPVWGPRFLLISGLLAAAEQAFIWLLRRRLRPIPPGDGLHLVLDRTGLSIVRAGAWTAAKHGGRGRRGWRKLHRGVDQSGVILVHSDASPVPPVAVWAALCGGVAGVGRGGGIARRGPTVGLAVSGSRPPRGLPRVQPRLARRLPPGKIVVAVARELAGFLWAVLQPAPVLATERR